MTAALERQAQTVAAGARMTNPVRVVVMGAGSIGRRHLEVFGGLEGVRALMMSRRAEPRAALTGAGYVTAQSLDDAVEMGATLCVVATETGRHLQDGVAALDRGLDVLVEKPLARTAVEADNLSRRATASGRRLFVGCVLRFSESLNLFRESLGKVGRLHAVRVECQSYLPDWRPTRPYRETYSARADEGGVLRDVIHEIDYAGWLLGWPLAVEARVRNLDRLGIGAEEAAELMWETPEGCAVSLGLDYLSRPPRRYLRACGELGTLEWDGIQGTVTLGLPDSPPTISRSSQTREEMLSAQARAFIDAHRSLVDPRLTTGEDGARALAVCDAARRASETRREAMVEYL